MSLKVVFVPHLLFGDADIAQVRLESLVRLLGEHPVAAERLTKHRLQEEVGLLGVVHHDHKERYSHDQTGGDQRLPLWRERENIYDKSDTQIDSVTWEPDRSGLESCFYAFASLWVTC